MANLTNKNLTAANEAEVLKLVQNVNIKAEWQCLADYKGRCIADVEVCKKYELKLSTLKAARFYW